MSDAENFETVADGLCEVLLALEDVDLNPMLDDDVRAVLDCKEALHELTQRYRHDQHALERLEENAGSEVDR